jgi:hypothetical protein
MPSFFEMPCHLDNFLEVQDNLIDEMEREWTNMARLLHISGLKLDKISYLSTKHM